MGYAQRRATVDGEPVKPTATKYAVLYQLAVQALRVPPYSLQRDVVNWLRRKLEDDAGNHRY